jgi:hypothetical protein
MFCKSLVAPLLVGAVLLYLTGTVPAEPLPPPTPVARPIYFPPPVRPPAWPPVYPPVAPPIYPGQLPALEPQPTRHTLTIYNGPHVAQQNFVEKHGAWRSSGEFKDYDVFFRDSPTVPWRYYGTYSSAPRAEEAACLLRANGNLASVREHCA